MLCPCVLQGHFSERDAAHVMRQLLEFLAFAHDECNIVHRDIKPENLLLLDTDAPQSQERVARIRAAGGNPEGVEAMALKVCVRWCCTEGSVDGARLVCSTLHVWHDIVNAIGRAR